MRRRIRAPRRLLAAGLAGAACFVGAAAAIAAGGAPAQAATVSYVRAGRLLDTETGQVLRDRLIRIVDGRVVEVTTWQRALDRARLADRRGGHPPRAGARRVPRHGLYDGDYIDTVGSAEHWPEDYLRKNRDTTEAQRAGFRAAVQAGVKLTFGTDAGVYPHGQNARQFVYMVRHGMTPLQAIRSATTVAAESLGWSRDVGALSPGH